MVDKVDSLPLITTPQAFLDFLALLQEDFRTRDSQWENGTLPVYLEAMQA